MTQKTLSRRGFMQRAGLIGCSLAASPLLTPVTFAAAPWDTRLVVIILRGGMDGIDVVRPEGDPAYAALRPQLHAQGPSLPLDGYFGLHPALADLLPLWQAEELGFVHAVSTPYRDKRSHFDGQDLLEAGTTDLATGVRDGWLNRMLQQVPGAQAETAYAIGTQTLNLLDGAAPVARWAPDADLRLSPQALRLAELVMEDDAEMHAAFTQARMLSDAPRAAQEREKRAHVQIARFAAERLREEARVAAFSLNGWDTHSAQHRSLPRGLQALSDTILALKQDMGTALWGKTAVVAMTEFGRTARENGSGGTDHGTGSAMVLAGGAVRGGRVYGAWPGLDEASLYDRRDLMPTHDVRAQAAWVMRGLVGLDRDVLENHVFPGLELGPDLGLIR